MNASTLLPTRLHLPLFILLALGLTLVMQLVGAPLTTAAAPAGIVSFEFAANLATAEAILASWDAQASLHAALSLGLDYLYLVSYAAAISLAALKLAERFPNRSRMARIGRLLAWGVWIAAGLDAIENFALIQLLLGSGNAVWPPVAFACAAVKFALVVLGLIYVLAGGVLSLLRAEPAARRVG